MLRRRRRILRGLEIKQHRNEIEGLVSLCGSLVDSLSEGLHAGIRINVHTFPILERRCCSCDRFLKDADKVVDAIFLVLRNAFRDPGNVSYFL